MPSHKLFSKIDRFQHVCYAKDPHKKIMQKTHTKIYILLNLEISSRKENNFASSPDERP